MTPLPHHGVIASYVHEHHLLPDKYGGEDQNDEKKDHSTDEAKDQSIESRTLTVQFALLAAVLVEVIIVTPEEEKSVIRTSVQRLLHHTQPPGSRVYVSLEGPLWTNFVHL